jgi:hypothetical protein
MNPEFRRNLWLSVSTHRLVAMPALLGLSFLAIVLSGSSLTSTAGMLYTTSTTLFIFIVWLWGARNANSAIVDELRDRTWDQQRMSALAPWTMTWGKLFGATSFNWYGGVLCLLIASMAGIAGHKALWPVDLLSLVATGIMLHATLIALNLHAGQLEMNIIQRGGLGWLAIVFVLIISPILASMTSDVLWWDMQISHEIFMLGSTLFFAGCATFAAWRVMSNALQVRTLPWAWPLFAFILAVYFAGITDHHGNPQFVLSYTGLIISAIMTYAALFTEPTGLLVWNKLNLRLQARDWRGWLEHLPLWPTTLVMALCFALSAEASLPPQLPHFVPLLQEPFSMALMLLRDSCIVLFFSFAANARRAIGTAALYLFVIDFLLPFLFKVAGLDTLSYFFLPTGLRYSTTTDILVMAIHVAIAVGAVAWRVRSQKQS